MMRTLLMPKLGLTMTEGVIAEWTVEAGTPFKADAPLFVVETDKVANEIPAEADGVLSEILAEAGKTVQVGEAIAYWDDGMPDAAGAAPGGQQSPHSAATLAPTPAAFPAVPPAGSPAVSRSQRVLATPLARRIAGMENIDLASVQGSGPRNAVRAQDVRDHAQQARRKESAPLAEPGIKAAIQTAAAAAVAMRIKPNFIQAAMARRLTAVKQEVPHFYLAVEAEVSKLLALREEINRFNPEVRITVNHFIIAAVARALTDFPKLNAVWSEGEIVRFAQVDVGVAVNSDKGLFVPVVRDIGRQTLQGIASSASALIGRAREGTLTAEQMQGGAITVSNAGMFNVKFMTPIINPGQAMILGVGSVSQQFRPDSSGQPLLTREIGLVLAADHRLMDGVSGLTFLNRVVSYLAQPLQLLMGPAAGGAEHS